MTTPLIIERQGDIETWTLNDPATRNALTDTMVLGLFEACVRAKADASLRGIVLTGAGGAFCAGGSLSNLAGVIGQPLPPGETDPLIALNRAFGDVLHALTELPQWLLCAVDGPAMGGGFGLVCCADIVVATERASFGTPEVTIGLPPAQIAPFVWQRLGDATARHCLLGGLRWSATQAQAAGLVNRVVDDDALNSAVTEATQALMRAAPGAVAATKQLLHRLRDKMPDLRDEAARAFAASLRGPEAAAGLEAFAKKRSAPWVGRP